MPTNHRLRPCLYRRPCITVYLDDNDKVKEVPAYDYQVSPYHRWAATALDLRSLRTLRKLARSHIREGC